MEGEDNAQKGDPGKETDKSDQEEITKRFLKEVRVDVEERLEKNEHKHEATDSLSEKITGAKPKERSEKPHTQLETLKDRSTSQAAAEASPKGFGEIGEIAILNKKLGLELGPGSQDFKHEVDPENYVQHNVAKSSESEFSSEEERLKSQKYMTLDNTSGSGYVGLRSSNWEVDPSFL